MVTRRGASLGVTATGAMGWRMGFAYVLVSSATAFFAQVSSTKPFPSAAAAINAAVAALLRGGQLIGVPAEPRSCIVGY